jgi:diacylglycerol kinase (ATP)
VSRADVVAIVNPLSGAGADTHAAERRVELLRRRFDAASVNGDIHVTAGPHHAFELARAAVEAGSTIVIAWGGDGTINEVGAALIQTPVALGVVPSGSGNGFAAELRLPREPSAALDVALGAHEKRIDAGRFAGRSFFNIAGVGVDAAIAARFNRQSMGQRGMGPYVRIGVHEAFRYRGRRYRVTLDGEEFRTDALLIAFANGCEYGNRIRIAPHARMDDGVLEAVVVEDRSVLRRLWDSRHLALGSVRDAPGILFRAIKSATVESDGELPYHVDGEMGSASGVIHVGVQPGALRVKVPYGDD